MALIYCAKNLFGQCRPCLVREIASKKAIRSKPAFPRSDRLRPDKLLGRIRIRSSQVKVTRKMTTLNLEKLSDEQLAKLIVDAQNILKN